VYLNLALHLFAEKYFEYSEDILTLIDKVRNISQERCSSQNLNIQDDRVFQVLSEYIITFLKKRITL
jgi:hypothetical protein